MDRRGAPSAARTPSRRRAFGTRLSANSPFPSSHRSTQQPLAKSASKSATKSASRPKSAAKSASKSGRKPPKSGSRTAEGERSGRETTTPATKAQRNLMAHFNSPTVAADSDANINTSGAEREGWAKFTPKKISWKGAATAIMEEEGEGGAAEISPSESLRRHPHGGSGEWTRFTPRAPWRGSAPKNKANEGSGNASGSARKAPTRGPPSSAARGLAYSTIGATAPSHSPTKQAVSPSSTAPSLPRAESGTTRQRSTMQVASAVVSPTSTVLTASTAGTLATTGTTTTGTTTTGTTGTAALAAAAPTGVPAAPAALGPSEYAVRFPPGPVPLTFEAVTIASGRPTGCTVAKILPGFEESASYLRLDADGGDGGDKADTRGKAKGKGKTKQRTIQANDLVVSLNAVPVLSRPHAHFLSLLAQFRNQEKVVVFRSIEDVWRNSFHRRTMRHVRTGRRVATALDDGSLERELGSWVETPTQVAVRSRRRRRDGSVGEEAENDGAGGAKEEAAAMQDTEEKLASIDESTAAISRLSLALSPAAAPSPRILTLPSVPETPSTLGGTSLATPLAAATPSTLGSPAEAFVFSPSNVKKLSRAGALDRASPVAATPRGASVAGGDVFLAATEKKSNVRGDGNEARPLDVKRTAKKSNVRGARRDPAPSVGGAPPAAGGNSTTKSLGDRRGCTSASADGTLTERIGRALVGGYVGSRDFERSLRLKKGVLGELKHVHTELKRLRAHNGGKGGRLYALMSPERSPESDDARTAVKERLDAAEERATAAEQERDEARTSLVASEEAVATLRREKAEADARLQERTAEMERHERELGAARRSVAEATGGKDRLKTRVQGLIAALARAKGAADASAQALEEERSARLALAADLTKAKEDADSAVAKLEERMAAIEGERDEARAGLERERSDNSALAGDLAKAKEDAAASALVKLNSDQRDASQDERVRMLEERLEEEEQKATKSAKDQLATIDDLAKRIAVAEADRDDTRLELENERSSSASLKSERDELASHLDEARSDVARLESEREEAIAKSRTSEADAAKLQEENETLAAKLDAANAKNSELESDIEVATINYNGVHARHEKCIHELERLAWEKDAGSSELSDLKARLDDATSSSESTSGQVAQLTAQVRALTGERDELLQKAKEASEGTTSSNARLEKLEAQVGTLTQERDELAAEVEAGATSMAEEVAKAKEDASVSRRVLEMERARSAQRDDALVEQVRGLEERLDRERQLAASRSGMIERLEERVAVAEADCHAKEQSVFVSLQSALEKERLALSTCQTALQTQIQAASNTVASFDAERATLQRQIEVVENSAKSRESDNVRLKASVDSLETERAQLTGQMQALQLEASDRKSEIQSLTSSLKEKQEELTALISHRQQLEHQINELKEQLSLCEEKGRAEKEVFERSEATLMDRLDKSQNEAILSKKLCAELRAKLETAEALLDESDAEIQGLSSDCDSLEKQVDELSSLWQDAKDALSQLKEENRSLTAELSIVAASRDSLCNGQEAIASTLEAKQSDNESLSRELMSATAVNEELRREKELISAVLKSKESENASLEKTVGELTSQLSSGQMKHDEQARALQKKLDMALEDASKSKAVSAELQTKLDEARSHLDESSLEAQRLAQECHRLEVDLAESRSTLEGKELEVENLTAEMRRVESRGQSQLEAHGARQRELDDKISNLASEKNGLAETAKKLREQLQLAQGQSRREALSYEVTLSQQRNDVKVLQNAISGFEIKCSHLTTDLEAARAALGAEESDLLRIAGEKESIEDELDRCVEEAKRKEEAYLAKENELSALLAAEKKSMQDHVQHLEGALSQTREALLREKDASIERESTLGAEFETLRKEIVAMKDAKEDLCVQLERSKESLAARCKEIDILKDESSQLREMNLDLSKSLASAEADKASIAAEVDAFAERIALAVEKEEFLSTRVKEMEGLLRSSQCDFKTLSDALQSAELCHEKSLSEMEQAHRSHIDAVHRVHDEERNELKKRVSSLLSTELKACKEEINELRAALEEGIALNATLSKSDKDKEHSLKLMKEKLQSMHESQEKSAQAHERQLHHLQEQCHGANKELEVATMKWALEKSSLETKIEILRGAVDEERLLHTNLAQKVEISSSLKARGAKLDKMLDTIARMDAVCDEYHAGDSTQRSELEELRSQLQSKESANGRLSVDLSLAQDEIVSLRAEVACAKEIGQSQVSSVREELGGELNSLMEEWRNFHRCLSSLVGFTRHGDELPLEESLPEMTSLLNALFAMFQEKADQARALEMEKRQWQALQADRALELESPASGNRRQSDNSQALLNAVEHELRDLCIQLDAPTPQDSDLSQHNAIHEMLQSLRRLQERSIASANTLNDSNGHELEVSEFLSEIEEAKQRVEDMSFKLESEAAGRMQSEMQHAAGAEALASANDKIATLEERIGEMEDCHRKKAIELLAQRRKSELKYERAQSEIESCQKLAIQLKTSIIEKNQEIESKEAAIMDLQYKVDDLSSRADGWKGAGNARCVRRD
ncbi:hypothetical protein ACHAXT_009455 [Thalassiosira profunda]